MPKPSPPETIGSSHWSAFWNLIITEAERMKEADQGKKKQMWSGSRAETKQNPPL